MEVSYTRDAAYTLALGAGAALAGALYVYCRRDVPLDIRVVTSEDECDAVIEELRSGCRHRRVVGFDCEWVNVKGGRHPVALLQLATHDGLCALFRLNHLRSVPHSLKRFLEDSTIYKVGVAPIDDARNLITDYSIVSTGTLDIRHIVKECGHESGGLAHLAGAHLGIKLDKHWTIRASDWEAPTLSERQQKYAAKDAYVAVKIFVKFIERYYGERRFIFFMSSESKERLWKNIGDICEKYLDLSFKVNKKPGNANKTKLSKKILKQPRISSLVPRSKPFYQNGFMLAPDGELLCTCDKRKAQWYIDKGLADKVKDEPFTVQLRFEPAGRAVGEVGRYYKLQKENKCVVCGKTNSYIRKNVVPREYRKYFPEIMKDHSSHDVVLLCLPCHQRSNVSDRGLRFQLAVCCDAPLSHCHDITTDKYIEDTLARSIQSAARALQHDALNHNLPTARRKELENIVLKQFPNYEEITEELLDKACTIQILYENESYEPHGRKVVEYYIHVEKSLLKLEKEWREHFLRTMVPKYLPELWCINHNEERLMIRVREGRIDPSDMKTIGLQPLFL